ncbi:M14 family metallopeptidase [Spongiimicrobium salis]|uniref:M14 family metallopeptidase n=1 Tax=Spongiimicrobium salis TaxID=1667022 RepID=UPI00374CF9D5
MRSYFKVLAISLFLFSCETEKKDKVANFQTHFETTKGKETATYDQTIDFYIRLAREFPEINIQTIGETDSGNPLHIVTFNPDGDFNFQKIGEDKTIILINNGIHPGESDGIDATMLLYRDLATENIPSPKNTILVTIPIYNIGGALNRNSGTRVNQNGPVSYGFRGNAQNYDLNRDFIKADTKNAKTFANIFHLVSPDIFIDNHVSNGADYQYTLTHLFTQHNKLGGDLGQYLHQEMMPMLEEYLEADQWDITPYVNVFNDVPEKGFSQFVDYPRYSTGYTTLWNTLGMMVETHMLKPYKQRVDGTYALMSKIIAIADKDSKKIKQLRQNAFKDRTHWTNYPVQWKIDTTKSSILNFKGYEGTWIPSEITGFPRLKYDRNQPFVKEVEYRNYLVPSASVTIPEAYIVKKGWAKIMERMDMNQIDYDFVTQDTLVNVEVYHIDSYKTRQNAYEGHYLHYDTKVQKSTEQVAFHEGDYIIPTNQPGIRYILETLEPEASDSFFNWNFFDTVLQQKEGFSPYVFEDTALALLKKDEKLREAFLLKKQTDTVFAGNWYNQLNWVYERSQHYEKAYLRYPVYRYLKKDMD